MAKAAAAILKMSAVSDQNAIAWIEVWMSRLLAGGKNNSKSWDWMYEGRLYRHSSPFC